MMEQTAELGGPPSLLLSLKHTDNLGSEPGEKRDGADGRKGDDGLIAEACGDDAFDRVLVHTR